MKKTLLLIATHLIAMYLAVGCVLIWTTWPVYEKEPALVKAKAAAHLIIRWPAYIAHSRQEAIDELQPDGYFGQES